MEEQEITEAENVLTLSNNNGITTCADSDNGSCTTSEDESPKSPDGGNKLPIVILKKSGVTEDEELDFNDEDVSQPQITADIKKSVPSDDEDGECSEEEEKIKSPILKTDKKKVRVVTGDEEEGECVDEEEEEDNEKKRKKRLLRFGSSGSDEKEAGAIDDEDDEDKEDPDELEEGEVSDDEERQISRDPKPLCRFFQKGQCTWGNNCRSVSLKKDTRFHKSVNLIRT